MTGIACHMSSDSALRRSGLLKIIQPMAPSFSAIIRSVGDIIDGSSSDHFLGAQLGDRLLVIAMLAQHRVGMLAALRRRRADLRGRAAQTDGLPHHLDAAERRMIDWLRDADM